MIELSEQQVFDQLAQRLVGVHPDVESGDITRLVNEEYSRFEGCPIRDYIPCLSSGTPPPGDLDAR
jgi:hypothetical protein